MDMSTGKKYAKLLDDNDKEAQDSDMNHAVVVHKDGSVEHVNKPKSSHKHHHEKSHQDSSEKAKTMHKPKEIHRPKPYLPQSDTNNFYTALGNLYAESADHVLLESVDHVILKSLESTDHVILKSLDTLEDLCHEIDFGVLLAQDLVMPNGTEPLNITGLSIVTSFLSGKYSDKIQARAATVIGTAVQNNPFMCKTALEQGLIHVLMSKMPAIGDAMPEKFQTDTSAHVRQLRSRILYAISNILRGSLDAIEDFLRHDGMQFLLRIYREEGQVKQHSGDDLRSKCATLISDNFADPSMRPHGNSATFQPTGTSQDLSMEDYMREWCSEFQSSLTKSSCSTDTKEKLLVATSMIKSAYPKQCQVQDGFQAWLDKEMAHKDADFEEYNRVLVKVKQQVS